MSKSKKFREKYGLDELEKEVEEEEIEEEEEVRITLKHDELYLLFKSNVFATDGSLTINLPLLIADNLNINVGDVLYILVEDSKIIMAKDKKYLP